MKIIQTVFLRIVPCLALLVTACATPKPQVPPSVQAGDPAPSLAQPLRIETVQRFNATPD